MNVFLRKIDFFEETNAFLPVFRHAARWLFTLTFPLARDLKVNSNGVFDENFK